MEDILYSYLKGLYPSLQSEAGRKKLLSNREFVIVCAQKDLMRKSKDHHKPLVQRNQQPSAVEEMCPCVSCVSGTCFHYTFLRSDPELITHQQAIHTTDLIHPAQPAS
jgi:hypothetical protein